MGIEPMSRPYIRSNRCSLFRLQISFHLDCPHGFMEESHSTTELLTLRSPYEFRSRGLHLTCITYVIRVALYQLR